MFLAPPPTPEELAEGATYQNEERRRRRGQDKYLRGLSSYHPQLQETAREERDYSEVYIQGYAAEIFKDDETALGLHAERHMIPWRGEEQDPIMIDRFDGRALLDDRAKFMKLKSRHQQHRGGEEEEGGWGGGMAEEEAMLDQERYRDIREEQPLGQDSKGGGGDDEKAGTHGERASAAVEEEDEEPFAVTFPLPPHLITPTTDKVHRRIGMTARRTRKDNQLEFLLKVRQADKPEFSFLNPDDPLHPYYLYLKEEEREPDVDYSIDPRTLREQKLEAERREKEEEVRNKLAVRSLLGDAYYDSDEDDEDDVLVPPKDRKVVIDKLADFVMKNGPEFEEKVREKESGNPRFSFLAPLDPYNPYYRSVLRKRQKEAEPKVEKEDAEGVTVEGEGGANAAVEQQQPEDVLSETRAPIVIALPKLGVAKKGKEEGVGGEEEKGEEEEDEGEEGGGDEEEENGGEGEKGEGQGQMEEEGGEEEVVEGEEEGEGQEEEEEEEEEAADDEEAKRRRERLRRAKLMMGRFKIAMEENGRDEKGGGDQNEVEEGEIPITAVSSGEVPSTKHGEDEPGSRRKREDEDDGDDDDRKKRRRSRSRSDERSSRKKKSKKSQKSSKGSRRRDSSPDGRKDRSRRRESTERESRRRRSRSWEGDSRRRSRSRSREGDRGGRESRRRRSPSPPRSRPRGGVKMDRWRASSSRSPVSPKRRRR